MKPSSEWVNKLFLGDNLVVLRDQISDGIVDLIYLDPPFKSDNKYQINVAPKKGAARSQPQIAFKDSWHWQAEFEQGYQCLITKSSQELQDLMRGLYAFLGQHDMMAYLIMMAERLVEMHRVLKPGGNIYVHCDPTTSHYLKLLLDAIFGFSNYHNELIWHYGGRGAKAIAKQFPKNHDVIFLYSKSGGPRLFHRQNSTKTYTEKDARKKGFQKGSDERWFKTAPRGDYTNKSVANLAAEDRIYHTRTGNVRIKYFLESIDGRVVEQSLVGDTWTDIPDAMHMGKERLGYPTQKPESLLKRIIQSGSDEGSLVLDPFCGCGTTIAAAESLNRRWIGIDNSDIAISLTEKRMGLISKSSTQYQLSLQSVLTGEENSA